MDDLQRTIFIPLGAAAITGAFCGALVLALGAWFGWPAAWAAIAAAGAALVSWFGWSARFARLLEYKIAPNLPKVDPAQAVIAKAQTIDLHIHEVKNGYAQGAFLDRLPVSEQALAALAEIAMTGGSLTTAQVTARGIIDRASWEALRDRFIGAGLLAWRGSRAHGCEVTGRGMAIFARLANAGDRPTPHPAANTGFDPD